MFNTTGFEPRARERTNNRHIDAELTPSVISPGENVTLTGWFSDGNGDGIADGSLNLYWFNFADRIWDRYQNRSEAITNNAGYFALNVTGPNLTGLSLPCDRLKEREYRKTALLPDPPPHGERNNRE